VVGWSAVWVLVMVTTCVPGASLTVVVTVWRAGVGFSATLLGVLGVAAGTVVLVLTVVVVVVDLPMSPSPPSPPSAGSYSGSGSSSLSSGQPFSGSQNSTSALG